MTNDGEQSRKALDVYLASVRGAETRGRREPVSYILELGVGTGLFAKLFLDQLRDRSTADGTGDYERTRYLICDSSPTLLEDTRRSGVFAEHEDRIERLNLPIEGLHRALHEVVPPSAGAIRVVHANYVLDSLPFTILSQRDSALFELRIRTHLRPDARHPRGVPAPLGNFAELATWLDELGDPDRPSAHDALLYDGEYVQVDARDLPYASLIPSPATSPTENIHGSRQLVHGFGALACLGEVASLLRSDGYFIAMDYGYDGPSAEPLDFQCFGTSIATGVNFGQLDEFARSLPGVTAVAPDSDPTSLRARMFAGIRTSSRL